ncbi:sensor histidine kinase [Poseidonocella sedimentorum]|uniref:C4-dicarboxylate transport sensor protein DctB n=1 Tax=Poseidonocella sedimentorum TaxID=871652 RepID=A0A1I6DT49_9RHOB|nr:ATP-binding protein [Poseidonocella sedimentorum]SFR08625.1 two-component system, NtrC family, C4-dicarboxylate transport sensor histidine kinase DctB [Poseidonocella sedimentorum]
MTAPLSPASRPSRKLLRIALLLAVLAGTALAALPRIERYFLIETAEREEATLRLATESLRGALNRSEALPRLLAERPMLKRLLREPQNVGLLPYVNEQLRQTALQLDLADVYVMDIDGTTIAASNYRRDTSFVGQTFDYRPYFTDALRDGIGRFHALGVTSGQRGYFFAAPVVDGAEVLGVVAVKILLDKFEAAWRDAPNKFVVTDMNEVIFLSDRSDWHFRSFGEITPEARDYISRTRQYPLDALIPIRTERRALDDGHELLAVRAPGGRENFVVNTGLVASAGWRVSVLTPTGPALAQARQTLAISVLLVWSAGLLGVLYLQRRAQLLDRLAQQRRYHDRLERRVSERTRELNDANTQLTREVEDRRAAEDKLRRTQKDLVQAGKLAALGQMSAAFSHEFNQPLAAVKAYADNAVTFLARDRVSEARENVRLISQMADRMAAISRHLRNFARRPQDKIGPVPVRAALQDALDLLAPQLNASGVKVVFSPPEAEIEVMGGRVRLQQVIVNLLTNAIDAMEAAPVRRIDIGIERREDRLTLRLRDHGPGIDEAARDQLFDPFFTTKETGKGLGLGLSISYNIIRDFGGRMSAENHPGGGAVFTVDLAVAPRSAAARGQKASAA